MDNARIQQKATPDITYRKPANSFVAGFIGVTNFLDGLVHSTDGELVRYAAGVQQLVGKWSGLSEPPQAGSQVTGALSAENVTIAEQSDDHRRFETIVEGTVLDAIYEGERVVYEIAVPAADGAVIRAYHHQSDARPVFDRGARVHLGWNAQDLMVFGD
jgi:putative spermidine/putrescine transport system ATP-binding protein